MKRYVINHITELRNVGGFPVTTSTYDMGDRRTEVNHPASGITSFTYDALGKPKGRFFWSANRMRTIHMPKVNQKNRPFGFFLFL